jgi:hypothetical protein
MEIKLCAWTFTTMPDPSYGPAVTAIRVRRDVPSDTPVDVLIPADHILAVAAELVRVERMLALKRDHWTSILEISMHGRGSVPEVKL